MRGTDRQRVTERDPECLGKSVYVSFLVSRKYRLKALLPCSPLMVRVCRVNVGAHSVRGVGRESS